MGVRRDLLLWDGAGFLWNCRNWRSDGTGDHTFRLAVRALRTCRILGNGFAMLLSVSHHLEPAYGAFTRTRALDEQVGLIVTNQLRVFGASRELFASNV